MKKNIFIITFLCCISTYAQDSVNTSDILTAAKKDYLYNKVVFENVFENYKKGESV